MEKILNITFCLTPEIETQWLDTTIKQYIPRATQLGVKGIELIQVIPTEQANDQGITYTIQLRFEDKGTLNTFREKHESSIEAEIFSSYGQKMLTFRLELNSIHKSTS